MHTYDIIAWQDTNDGMNLALARTTAGLAWMARELPIGERPNQNFLEFLESIPEPLSVGVIDPTGKILNFRSTPLH